MRTRFFFEWIGGEGRGSGIHNVSRRGTLLPPGCDQRGGNVDQKKKTLGFYKRPGHPDEAVHLPKKVDAFFFLA